MNHFSERERKKWKLKYDSLTAFCLADPSVPGGPRRGRSNPVQPLQGLHVSLHAVHRGRPPLPVRVLQLCHRGWVCVCVIIQWIRIRCFLFLLKIDVHPTFFYFPPPCSASTLLPASGPHWEEGRLLRQAGAFAGQLRVPGHCRLL